MYMLYKHAYTTLVMVISESLITYLCPSEGLKLVDEVPARDPRASDVTWSPRRVEIVNHRC